MQGLSNSHPRCLRPVPLMQSNTRLCDSRGCMLPRSRRPDVGYIRVAASASVPTVTIDKPWAVDEVAVDVVQDRDSTCHAVMTARVEATPMTIYTLFEREDYDKIFEIFKVVKLYNVLEDDGEGQRLIDLHVDAQWSFWKVSGDCFIPISMKMDRTKGEITFFQTQPGFLTEWRGGWKIMELDVTDRPLHPMDVPWTKNADTNGQSASSLVTLELTVKPSIVPPPPINRLLKGNTLSQMESLFRDLKIELNKGTSINDDLGNGHIIEASMTVDTILRNGC